MEINRVYPCFSSHSNVLCLQLLILDLIHITATQRKRITSSVDFILGSAKSNIIASHFTSVPASVVGRAAQSSYIVVLGEATGRHTVYPGLLALPRILFWKNGSR